MAFCQRLCNRVFQPPLQLRGVGIYSHACKQGCFQPCRPDGSGPGLVLRTRRSCGRTDGTAATWWRSTPGASPPAGWNEGYEPAILWGGDSADSPAALGFGPAWFGTRWAADVAERTEDTEPRLLCAPRRIYLGDGPGDPEPHGQNRRSPRSERFLSNRPNKLLGTHPLNWFPLRCRFSNLERRPSSGGVSPLNWFSWRPSHVRLARLPNSGGIPPLNWLEAQPQAGRLPNSGSSTVRPCRGWPGCPTPAVSPRSTGSR